MCAWFKKIPEKCQLLVSKKKPFVAVFCKKKSANVQQMLALWSKNAWLLLLRISLHSKDHMCKMLKKPSRKLNILTRIASSIGQKKGKAVTEVCFNCFVCFCSRAAGMLKPGHWFGLP